MYLFSTCWLVSPRQEGQKKYLSVLGSRKISISIPLLITGPELRSTFKNHKALPVKDYPLASIQSLQSLIVVGHDQQKQEGRTVMTLQSWDHMVFCYIKHQERLKPSRLCFQISNKCIFFQQCQIHQLSSWFSLLPLFVKWPLILLRERQLSRTISQIKVLVLSDNCN